MLACGGIVIASTAPVLKEVCGTHAAYVDPGNVDAWTDAMNRMLTDEQYSESLRSGGPEWASRYTWSNAARQTHEVYVKALGIAISATGSSRSAA
jgi:alpha-1,3-rhamnosyl/mannosyltransferase